ncbi:MAG TPA: hypothetical protein VM658_17995 [bacterium]|nr:hypothetical protein [bacterium]
MKKRKCKKDVLIDEIRAVRHQISEEFGHDTAALVDYYRQLGKKYKGRFVGDSEPSEPSDRVQNEKGERPPS